MMRSKKKKPPETPTQAPASADRWQVDSKSRASRLVVHLASALLITEEAALDLIDFGSVHIDGRQARDPERLLEEGEEIWVYWPWQGTKRFYELDPSRILFRDRYVLAYDKEAGVPSQQTPSDAFNNLYAAVSRYLEREGRTAPYVALHHRLDRETSGVMLFALDRSANRRLGSAFEHHLAVKDYLAWVEGSPSREQWVSSEDIGRKDGRYCVLPQGKGKSAQTAFQVLHREEGRSLLWAQPQTGRTHQIRLHLAATGHPILGDRRYGGSPAERLFLHAYRLRLPHPVTGPDLTLIAPVPSPWPTPHTIALPE